MNAPAPDAKEADARDQFPILWFALLAMATLGWWALLWVVPAARGWFSFTADPTPLLACATPDLVLLVLGSLGVVWFGWRGDPGRAAWLGCAVGGAMGWATLWSLHGSLATGGEGWPGVVAMSPAALLSTWAALRLARQAPREPCDFARAFRVAAPASATVNVAKTGMQLICFWGFFLALLPAVIVTIQDRWLPTLDRAWAQPVAGWLLFGAMSALGLWSAWTMATRGRGTPIPLDAPRQLVVAGPYRFVRNPMALAGITQGLAVGLVLGSWPVLVYALTGAFLWHRVARPPEERDLTARFGAPYLAYRAAVPLWIPRGSPWSPQPRAQAERVP